jgi:FMN-dependent NADH-azoreductase
MGSATNLKAKQPNAEVTVRDLQTGKVTVIKHPAST